MYRLKKTIASVSLGFILLLSASAVSAETDNKVREMANQTVQETDHKVREMANETLAETDNKVRELSFADLTLAAFDELLALIGS